MRTLALAVLLLVMNDATSEEKGIIGEYKVDGQSVVMKFVDELPPQRTREKYRWLTVVSWKYDGAQHSGMPSSEDLERMKQLERSIESNLIDSGLCLHAYSRTGNNLKELVYYIFDRDEFLSSLNRALKEHPRYPIDINFYEDAEWKDFQTILGKFDLTGQ